MRLVPIVALVLLAGCAPLDELIFGPAPQDPNASASPAATQRAPGDGTSPGPVGPCAHEGWPIRILREATRSIPWSGPAISLAVYLYARLRRRSNQFRAMVEGVDYATHNGELSKDTLYQAIENAARALTALDDFRRTVAGIKDSIHVNRDPH